MSSPARNERNVGTILGACVLLGRIAIGDWLTALIGLASLAVLFRWKVSNPMLIAAGAAVGLVAFPLRLTLSNCAGGSARALTKGRRREL